MEKLFSTALNEKTGESGIKELCLTLKSSSPKLVKTALVLFTPHYQPLNILKTVKNTLNPMTLISIQAPELIYEDRIIKKGIIGCCVNKDGVEFKNIILQNDLPTDIESNMRANIRDLSGNDHFIFSSIPPQFHSYNYLRGIELAMGRSIDIIGAGCVKKYAVKQYYTVNDVIYDGLMTLMIKGLEMKHLRTSGFLPLGKPFTVTKVAVKRGVIMEINGEPAVNIYKNYLEDKYDIFIKNQFFRLYPLGTKEEQETILINVIDILEDGSLFCVGNLKENVPGRLMFLHPPALFENFSAALEPLRKSGEGLIFMVNSFVRKKIMSDYADEEIKAINHFVGEKSKIIGICCDYYIFPNKQTREATAETGNLLITLWK